MKEVCYTKSYVKSWYTPVIEIALNLDSYVIEEFHGLILDLLTDVLSVINALNKSQIHLVHIP